MTPSDKIAKAMEQWLTAPEATEPVDAHLAALLSHALAPAVSSPGAITPSAITLAELARHLDGANDATERARILQHLASSPAGLADAAASMALLDAIGDHLMTAPDDLLTATETSVHMAEIIPLHRPAAHQPRAVRTLESTINSERFMLLAAASTQGDGALLCRSQSGIWTLEIFAPVSDQDRTAGHAVLLLSVDPEHRANYEGREARIFVELAEEVRVLAKAPVHAGEVFADISVLGLDLAGRDAVNVTFGPAPVN